MTTRRLAPRTHRYHYYYIGGVRHSHGGREYSDGQEGAQQTIPVWAVTAPVGVERYSSAVSATRLSGDIESLISWGPVTVNPAGPVTTPDCETLVQAVLSSSHGAGVGTSTLGAKWSINPAMVECSTHRTASTQPVTQSASGRMYLHFFLPDGSTQTGASQFQNDLEAELCGGVIRRGTVAIDQHTGCPARESSPWLQSILLPSSASPAPHSFFSQLPLLSRPSLSCVPATVSLFFLGCCFTHRRGAVILPLPMQAPRSSSSTQMLAAWTPTARE